MLLFFPKPELLLFMCRYSPTPLVKFLLAAPSLHHNLIIIQSHRYLTVTTFDIPRPGIVGILLKAFRTIISLYDSKISDNLSVNHPFTLLPEIQVLLHSQVCIRPSELLRVGVSNYADHCCHQCYLHKRMKKGE